MGAGAPRSEKFGVLRIRTRETALDVIDAKRVEPLRDTNLVLHREGDAGALRAVTQRGVVELDGFFHYEERKPYPAAPLAASRRAWR